MAYFDAGKLPNLRKEFVCFLDIMGTKSKMKRSIKQASNMMFKLHATAIETLRKNGFAGIAIYPIMDGMYISTRNIQDLKKVISDMFSSLLKDFYEESEYKHLYFCRGSIAYGDVIHGKDVPYDASLEFTSRIGYKEQVLIGAPMIYAFEGEDKASPFGIYIHSSARNFNNWHWYDEKDIDFEELKNKITRYYRWADQFLEDYLPDRKEAHKKLIEEYFRFKL